MSSSDESRDRILRAIDGPKAKRRRGFGFTGRGPVPVLLALAVAVVGISLITQRSGNDGEAQPLAEVLVVRDATLSGRRLRVGRRIGRGRVIVADGGLVDLRLDSAALRAPGPAEFELGDSAVMLHVGVALIDGRAVVEGAGCRFTVDGQVRVERFPDRLLLLHEQAEVQAEGGDRCLVEQAAP